MAVADAARAGSRIAATLVALAAVFCAGRARAEDPSTQDDPGARLDASLKQSEDRADDWAFEEMRYFFGFFYQQGHGLQSQAGPVDGKGDERSWIVEPLAAFRFRTNRQLDHEVVFPIDIVSSASPDALDVVSGASRVTQAFSLDIQSTYSPSQFFDIAIRWGPHFEETLRSFFAGPSLTFHFAEDNTVIGISGYVVADAFDPIKPDGHDAGQDTRITLNGNLAITQVISPTTLFDFSFGATTQSGVLQNSWNSVITKNSPGEDPLVYREPELFPENRFRSALTFRLSQHIPASHTTVKGTYRFYADENHVFANTGQVEIFQYLVPWLYFRVHGRLHVQPAADFWVPYLDTPPDSNQARTSDSDLATLISREAGLRLVLLRDRAPLAIRSNDTFDIGYLRYQRDNGLHVDFGSLGYARTFP